MSDKLVDQKTLEEITQSDKPYVQKRVLDRNGVYYIEGSDGKISVTWHAMENPYSKSTPPPAANDDSVPNFRSIM